MSVKLILQFVLALFMVVAGVTHFRKPRMFMSIMPPYLPYPRELVLLSGVAEVLLGVLLVVPQTTRLGAWGLVALFVAVFPANVHMAWHPEKFRKIPKPLLWLRLPLQGVLILWALWYT
ncbi:DoxX family protein [Corallococcus sp. bb12-1]|uniref:DoxX family protein n=1 Tax=Corallococcus sp. bb12-1 TaxID=2996784 RepID=UPI00226FC554|nr:DoxX family protein [Corallococcus sp. bb12-1]MCY1041481.1 DoxX family protein [Corallococcus sp. bb12-1]